MEESRTPDSLCPVGFSKQMPENKQLNFLTILTAALPVYAQSFKGGKNIYRYRQQQHNDCSRGPGYRVCFGHSGQEQMTRGDCWRSPFIHGAKTDDHEQPKRFRSCRL